MRSSAAWTVLLCATLYACQLTPPSLSDCDSLQRSGVFEFIYDKCNWRVEKREGPDFDVWEIKSLNGKQIAKVYWGGAPDIAFVRRNIQPRSSKIGSYELAEVMDESGYEAVLSFPKDRFGMSSFAHIFTPALDDMDLNKVKKLIRTARVRE